MCGDEFSKGGVQLRHAPISERRDFEIRTPPPGSIDEIDDWCAARGLTPVRVPGGWVAVGGIGGAL